MNTDSDKESDPNVLQNRWRSVETKLGDIVDCLRRESEFATGHLKRRITRVQELLQQQPTRDEVLTDRDALEMLLPLLVNQDGDVTVETSVRAGVQRIAGNDVYRRNWIQLFWYPAVVVICAFFVSVILSFNVAPQFEATVDEFSEFGFQQKGYFLPGITRLSLATASFLRTMWIPITVAALMAIIAAWWINKTGRRNNPSGLGWWDDQNVSVRGAVAVWASHLASLLQAGVVQADAFEIASRQTPKPALRNLSLALAKRDQFTSGSQHRHYFPMRKYAMLDHALQMGPGQAKVAALQEVAHYYRDRDRYVSTWWMAWLSTALLWMVGALVFGVLLAMFLPLNRFITGLSGLTGVPAGLGN